VAQKEEDAETGPRERRRKTWNPSKHTFSKLLFDVAGYRWNFFNSTRNVWTIERSNHPAWHQRGAGENHPYGWKRQKTPLPIAQLR